MSSHNLRSGRTQCIKVYITPEDEAQVRARADANGEYMNAYVYRLVCAALGVEPVDKPPKCRG